MKTSILNWSMLASWLMAFIYDRIRIMFEMNVYVLLAAAVLIMVVGLWIGLCAKNNASSEERA